VYYCFATTIMITRDRISSHVFSVQIVYPAARARYERGGTQLLPWHCRVVCEATCVVSHADAAHAAGEAGRELNAISPLVRQARWRGDE
jgi:hypothetical protein